ncbi:hypothetical protein FSP39_020475 [Pinctada imbricata]|uniref:AIG1-type G domain-containing protein n=1 Tax=Pinctada imbricata TaxID=66713 RepID=A0AA88YJ69_PINIB|nr:hypothetical protein FSP39_020475 [Pinctada imbricata]
MTGPVQTSLEKTGPRPPVLSECQSDSSGDNIHELAQPAEHGLYNYQSDEISRLHRKLLYTTIAIEYLHETVDDGRQKLRFVAAYKQYSRTPIEDSLEDVDDILQDLERRGLLGIGNYKILKDIVQFNVKIIEEIEKTEIAIRQIGGTVTPHTDNGCDIYLVAEVENSTTNEDEWKSASVAIKKIQLDLQSHHIKITPQDSHHFEWFSRNLEIHLNLMKESNAILRLCKADGEDERIKNFVELAKASKEKLISNDDSFHEFSIRWRTLNKLMIENCKLIAFLQGKGAEFEGYIQSSLFVFLSFRSLEMLDSFWNDYKSGSLNREMRNAFFTDGGPENENQALRLNLSEENYHRYRRFLENQLRTGHDEAAGGDTQQEEPTSTTNEDIITVSTDMSSGEHKATTSHSNVSSARSPPAKRIRKAEGQIGKHVNKQAESTEEEIRIVSLGKTGTGKSSTDVKKQAESTEEEIRIACLGKTGAGKSSTGNLLFGAKNVNKQAESTEEEIRIASLGKTGAGKSSTDVKKQAQSMEEEIRIVLLGKTGAGKSSTGNLLLGARKFQTGFSPISVSKQCGREEVTKNDKKYIIIDTPGFFDTRDIDEGQLNAEISRCIGLTSPGPHVLLYIQAPNRCTKEEESSIQEFLKVFGEDACKHMILVYVRKDEFEQNKVTFENYLKMLPKFWTKFISMCENRVLCIKNNNMESTEAECLRSEIDKLVSKNKRNYFHHDFSIGNKMHLDSGEKMFSSDEDKGSKKQFASTSKNIEGKMEKGVQYLIKYQADKEIGFLKHQLSLKQEELKQMQKEHDETLWQTKERARSNFESELRRREVECQRLQAQLETKLRRHEAECQRLQAQFETEQLRRREAEFQARLERERRGSRFSFLWHHFL